MPRQLSTRVLVPITFDAVSRQALEVARDLASATGAQLHVLHVWSAPYAAQAIGPDEALRAPGNLLDGVRHECAEEMREFLRSVDLDPAAGDVRWTIRSGAPVKEVLAYCAVEGCDLIVLGTHRHQGVSHWLLGSVAEEVLRHAPCPVLVVPAARKLDTPSSGV